MLTVRQLSFLILFFFAIAARGQDLPDSIGQAGVSFSLANYRAARLTDLHYDLVFHLPAERSVPVAGEEKISFRYSDNVESGKNFPLLLDFKGAAPLDLRVNGEPAPVRFINEHLQLPATLLRSGLNTVELRFVAGDAALNRNPDFLYTLLVPDRARTLFPCFDQPNLKAVFNLSLTKPTGWKAIANAPLLDSIKEGDDTRLRFRLSDKISTYLFSFAAGKFAAAGSTVDGRPMNFLFRETDSTKLRLSLDSI
ncbi:MAG TPA: hypothetical protein VN824_13080, partial [Puia sp.]|nr:hypothetical protein [Puia sp.]